MGEGKKNCVILAAGEGKRMFSLSSKVLCEVTYKPMVLWVIDAAKHAGIESLCVVVSSADVERAVGEGVEVAYQKERLGTGHAVLCASEFLSRHAGEDTLILYGDAPFIDVRTMEASYREHLATDASATIISALLDNPTGYGRIIRKKGKISAIIEQADVDDATESVREINSGAGWFKTDALLQTLGKIKNNNAQGEYYLTDVVSILLQTGKTVGVYRADTPDVTLGANSPLDLLNLNDIARERAIKRHLEHGVHFVSRSGVIIGPDVEIAPGAEILPGCILYGHTVIGRGAVIGPNTVIRESIVGENTVINASQVHLSQIGHSTHIGPFSHIRPDCTIGNHVKIGDFVELKNSVIGDGTSIAHLTYIGDSDVGRHCNFGCGTVTVNFDGEKKARTVIKDYAFIGCNTNLIPPVTVGEAAYTAAGSTIDHDVSDGALAIDRSPLVLKPGWGQQKLQRYVDQKKERDD